jgi:two-component system CAI-1 autoinducer sensor kinase/phosphatase CqsS
MSDPVISGLTFARTLRSLQNSYLEFHGPTPYKLPTIGILGAVTFPLYYYVWSQLFPQPYENLTLRLTGGALCLVIGLRKWWPSRLAKLYLAYCYVALMIAGPAFFTYMLLKNDVNSVWLMSTTAIILFTMLLYDLANAVIVTALGSVLGVLAFLVDVGSTQTLLAYLLLFPVFAFILAAVAFLSHSQSRISKGKLLATRAFAGSVAHEVRTPLLGIRFDAEVLETAVNRLMNSDRWALAHGFDSALGETRSRHAASAVKRILDHVTAANLVIDMLLMNLRQDRIDASVQETVPISRTVNRAMDKYPFQVGERELVDIRIREDFSYRGVEILMIHVLYNLLKNGLRAVIGQDGGRISIEADTQAGINRLTVSDSGRGIDPAMLPFIFVPFVTGNQDLGGTGVGLSFCRRVIEAFGGRISCGSGPAGGTRFTILLPRPEEAERGLHDSPQLPA